jgi:hypothetical protein
MLLATPDPTGVHARNNEKHWAGGPGWARYTNVVQLLQVRLERALLQHDIDTKVKEFMNNKTSQQTSSGDVLKAAPEK